jgi:hypothetical protein
MKADENGNYGCGCVWSLGGYWIYKCPEHTPRKRGAMKTLLIAAALLVLLPTASQADTIWQYTGNSTSDPLVIQRNPCRCALDITLDFNAAGILIAWDFTAGRLSLTPNNSILNPFNISQLFVTDLFGQSAWSLALANSTTSFFTGNFNASPFESTDSVSLNGRSYLYVQGNAGHWSDPISTPEPSTGLLIIGGIIILLLRKVRIHL